MKPIDLLIEVKVEVEKFLAGLEISGEQIPVVMGLGVVVGGEVVEALGRGAIPKQQMNLVAGAGLPEAGEVVGGGVGFGEEHG